MHLAGESLRALVDPAADQTHLLGGQRLGRRTFLAARTTRSGSAGSTTANRILSAGGSRSTRPAASPTGAATGTGTTHGRHGGFLIEPGHRNHKITFFAPSGHNDFAVLAAFEN